MPCGETGKIERYWFVSPLQQASEAVNTVRIPECEDETAAINYREPV